MTPDEYLHMVFDGPDCEFVDGEVVERAMPDLSHSGCQSRLIEICYELRKIHPLYAFAELRHRLSSQMYRIPDVAIHYGARPTQSVPSTPPLVAIEIISPDDRYTNIVRKLREYAEWGVPHIWVIDPEERTLSVFHDALRPVSMFEIPELGVTISKAEIFPKE